MHNYFTLIMSWVENPTALVIYPGVSTTPLHPNGNNADTNYCVHAKKSKGSEGEEGTQ